MHDASAHGSGAECDREGAGSPSIQRARRAKQRNPTAQHNEPDAWPQPWNSPAPSFELLDQGYERCKLRCIYIGWGRFCSWSAETRDGGARVRLRRRGQEQPLRYYLYISDAKLDMLFEQIDESILKRISAEVKIDFKLASLTLRQTDQPAPVRTAKLRVVERFIAQHHHVGTIQEPGHEYFRGQMDMQWGWLAGYAWNETPPIVIFRGRESSQFVALAGSRRHVLGERVADSSRNAEAWSALPNILAVRH
jgi:hypothetical protein